MLKIKQVNRSMTNRRIFRTLARDNCGESMEPGCDEVMYFGYLLSDEKKNEKVIACGSIQFCEVSSQDEQALSYFHNVTFLFVDRDFKRQGFGCHMLTFMEIDAWNLSRRPIRTDSAYKAVRFFEKCGYKQIAEPKKCIAGSSLFRYLYLMEKVPPRVFEELWVD